MDILLARPDSTPTVDAARPDWWPGLDGLRAVAVLGVLVYHQQASRLPGGFLGVSLFFTLSGFLLTTLVLREHAKTGTISLRHFWARRLRRLVPVALLGVGVALAVAYITVDPARLGRTIDDIRFAAIDLANWRFAFRSVQYGDTLSPQSPVLHYWSLAIEEQFYVVFPIVAALALHRSRRAFAIVLGLVVAVSLARQFSLHDINRIYLGTDTRAAELAIGGLAAMAWNSYGSRVRAAVLDVVGALSAVALGLAWLTLTLDTSALWHGGIVVHAMLSALLIVGAIGGRALPALLAFRPLQALGRISYGVYALHFPLFLLLTEDRVGVGGLRLFVVRLAASIAAAALAHRLVEAPVRWGGALPGRQGLLAVGTGIAAVLVLSTGLSSVTAIASSEQAAHSTVVTMVPPAPEVAAARAAEAPAAGTAPNASATPNASPIVGSGQQPAVPAELPAPRPVPRVLVVGDSTARANGAGMQDWAKDTQGAEVDVLAQLGCTFLLDGQFQIRDGWIQPPDKPCLNLIDDALQTAANLKPDLIVLFIGSIQLADWQLPGDTQYRGLGDPMLDARYVVAAENAITRLESAGVPLLIADVPTPNWNPDYQGAGILPGSGPVTINNAQRAAQLNQLNAAIVAKHPQSRVLPYAEGLEAPDGSVDPRLRPDGLHLLPVTAEEVMNAWLAQLIVSAYQSVTAELPTTLTRVTSWAP